MNFQKIYPYLITIIAIVLTISLIFTSKKEEQIETKNYTLESIMSRTSIRSYKEAKISSDTIERILKAAMAAPTAVNRQPWAFVVVDDVNILKQLADSLPNAGMAAKAPVAIVACGNMNKALDGVAREFWVQDVSAATENMLLAAHSLGLGAVWTGVYPNVERTKTVQNILNLPENLIPLCVVPMGFPADSPQPKDKWKPENVISNRYTAADSI
ncbi:MAG: nitroreductase family protein [Muribaculaceae bacterium]|nr:nitroreductase family protein [Muribaculaceae bacterium]